MKNAVALVFFLALALVVLLAPSPTAAKPPAPALPWWYQAPPVIPAWYYRARCHIAFWQLVQRTGTDAFGNAVTWQSYEPVWSCG